MKLSLDAAGIARLADLAYDQVLAVPPRTPERRAAVCLYYAATVPPAKSLRAVRSAIGTFAGDDVQADAIALLHQLAARLASPADVPAAQGDGAAPTGGNRS